MIWKPRFFNSAAFVLEILRPLSACVFSRRTGVRVIVWPTDFSGE